MKTQTTQKLKFLKLQRRLKLPLWACIGVLEALWHATHANAQNGDIGRLSNEEIAASIGWLDDADELVLALVETGWLDADPEFRLIVHNWSKHTFDHLKNNHKRHGKRFADEIARERPKTYGVWSNGVTEGGPKEAPKEAPKDGPKEAPYDAPPNQTKPNLTQPTKPNQPRGMVGACAEITEDNLRNTGWLIQSAAAIDPSEATRLNVVAAAERALMVGKRPCGLFRRIVTDRKWGLLSAEQIDRAQRRIAEHLARPGPPTESAASLAKALSIKEKPQ